MRNLVGEWFPCRQWDRWVPQPLPRFKHCTVLGSFPIEGIGTPNNRVSIEDGELDRLFLSLHKEAQAGVLSSVAFQTDSAIKAVLCN